MEKLNPAEQEIAMALLELATNAPRIWADLEANGVQAAAARARCLLAKYSQEVKKADDLELYWTGYAKERLSNLRGPLNMMTGFSSRPPVYSSLLLKKLRDVATPFPGGKSIAQIHPTIVSFYTNGSGDQSFKNAFQEMLQDTDNAVAKRAVDDTGEYAKATLQTRRKMLQSKIFEALKSEGFRVRSSGREFLVFEAALIEGKYQFNLIVDVSTSQFEVGMIRCSIAITIAGEKFAPASAHIGTIANFDIDDIDPYFSWCCNVRNDSYGEFCPVIDAINAVTINLYHRLDIILSNS